MKSKNLVYRITVGFIVLAVLVGFFPCSAEQVIPSAWASQTVAVCLTVQRSADEPLSGCKIDFLQLSPDPLPQADPNGDCSDQGDYYFMVPSGSYSVVANCGQKSAQGNFDFQEEYVHAFITVP